jgi:hypothetical protein
MVKKKQGPSDRLCSIVQEFEMISTGESLIEGIIRMNRANA